MKNILKKLKEYFSSKKALKKEVENLKSICEMLQNQIMEEEKNRLDLAIKEVLGRDIRFINEEAMNKQASTEFYNEAQALLKNKVFRSYYGYRDKDNVEFNGKITIDAMEFISKETQNFKEVENNRALFLSFDRFRKSLYKIQDPVVQEENIDDFEKSQAI